MHIQDIENELLQANALQKHIDVFWQNWICHRKQSKKQPRFPKKVLDVLPQIQKDLENISIVCDDAKSSLSGSKLALRLADDEIIEMVLLPGNSACISSQVGCAVGCVFCATGKCGLIRQLTDLEIISQVWLARKYQKIKKVVLMGMGEPSHNLRNVLSAVNFLGKYSGIGWKEIVISTIGDPRLFETLTTNLVKPALAISLHSMLDNKRKTLVPYAKMEISDLLKSSAEYAEKTNYPIQFQWTLMEGINDGDDEIEEILKLWGNRFAVLNMIPVNETPNSPFKRPSKERLNEIEQRLHAGGVLVKFRNSVAQDVSGGCGQLRARKINACNLL